MKKVSLDITSEVMGVLAMTPPIDQIKTAPKKVRRLMRIRANLFRELKALNKELRRHKPTMTFKPKVKGKI